MFNFLDKLVSRFSLILQNLAIFAFIALTYSVIHEVIARSLLNKPTIWSLEIVTYMISCVAFFGSAYGLRINKHLEVTLFTKILPDKIKFIFNLFSNLIASIFCFIAFYYGCKLINLTYILGVVSVSELRIPVWIPQLTVPIGFFALTLEFIIRIYKLIKFRKKS